MVLLPGSKRFISPVAAEWTDGLLKRLEAETGPMSAKQLVLSKLVPAMIAYTDFRMRFDIGQQPKFSRRTYRQIKQTYDQVLAGMLPYKLRLHAPKS